MRVLCTLLLLPPLLLFVNGCKASLAEPAALTLATTTSTRDSGLLDVLLPEFEEKTGIRVKAVAVGSGQALELGRRGDADVILSHAPEAEERFVAEGHSSARQLVMYNDFVLVGPAADPAEVSSADSVNAALQRVARHQAPFVSRGDRSGTHLKEQSLWRAAGLQKRGAWYIEGGSGMAETLRMASEKQAYTLADRGTFLSQRQQLDLRILISRDSQLHNPYAVLVVNPQKHPGVKSDEARRFAEFLQSPDVQARIASYGIEQFGEPLFFPLAEPAPH